MSHSTVHSLYEGTFSVALDKEFKPMDRNGKPEKGALRISIQPFLVKTEQRNFLLDTGLGEFGAGTSVETLRTNMAEHGIFPEDIHDIFLSHLHFDHLGGLANRENGYWELTFPYAKIWLSRRELDKVLEKHVFYDEEKTEFMWFLNAQADFHFYEDHQNKPYPEFEIVTVGGHTEYSVAIFYDDANLHLLMGGDVLPTKGHVNQKFAAKYDFNPKQSIESRNGLAKRAFAEKRIICAYHSSETALFTLSDYQPEAGYSITKYEAR
ncbi:MBL fold metallo-hydrolase [bacterium]|nr:MAG: MBL fold metallo-hydrolase [bacterium]